MSYQPTGYSGRKRADLNAIRPAPGPTGVTHLYTTRRPGGVWSDGVEAREVVTWCVTHKVPVYVLEHATWALQIAQRREIARVCDRRFAALSTIVALAVISMFI